MKTTIELPDELLREAKEKAARERTTLKEVVTAALRDHLGWHETVVPGQESWRRIFGRATPSSVRAVDMAVKRDLETIELEDWG